MKIRKISEVIKEDLNKKMVILAGPRQCGKTSLAKGLIEGFSKSSSSYYNFDIPKDKKDILHRQLNPDALFWVFDELHKYRHWKNWLKGVFDEFNETKKILVTGSAKLDAFSRGGDSLQGRYFRHRLHPFTQGEVVEKEFKVENIRNFGPTTSQDRDAFLALLNLGGFPAPFLSGSEKEASRWRLAYGEIVVREDIRDLERIIELDKLALLLESLPRFVGSVLSINSAREDLEIAFDTAKKWISTFDNLYLTFRLSPYGPPKIKAVKKEQKLYFWDWGRAEDPSSRLENLVAMHLLRLVHWMEDVEGIKCELRYFRTPMKHEVDFILLKKGLPWFAVEVKSSEEDLHPGLNYLLNRLTIPFAFQVHGKGDADYEKKVGNTPVRFCPIYKFLGQLP